MALGGAMEYSFPPLKGVMKMRILIANVVDKVQVGDARGDTWFGLFDEVGTIYFVEGLDWILKVMLGA